MTTRALFREDAYLTQCEATIAAVDEQGIHLDQTVFYPLGGGQAGDAGMLTLADGTCLVIADTRKAKFEGATPDDAVHVPAPDQDALLERFQPGGRVTAAIDWARRYRHMRLHTASHLICAVLPYPVDGCSITSEYARLDLATVEPIEREMIEARLAELKRAHPQKIEADDGASGSDRERARVAEPPFDRKPEGLHPAVRKRAVELYHGAHRRRSARTGPEPDRRQRQPLTIRRVRFEIRHSAKGAARLGLMEDHLAGRQCASTHVDGAIDSQQVFRPIIGYAASAGDGRVRAAGSIHVGAGDSRRATAREGHDADLPAGVEPAGGPANRIADARRDRADRSPRRRG